MIQSTMKILFTFSLLLLAACGSLVDEYYFHDIIEEVNSSGAKWKAGQNFGEDATLSSLKRLLGFDKNSPKTLPLREKHTAPDDGIPENFDSREYWSQCKSIRHIRDQGSCQSCWAVAAAGAFTDRLCIVTNGSFTMPLSSEELLACCSSCGNGCDGGNPYEAWKFLTSNGLVTGGDYNSNVGCQPYEIVSCPFEESDQASTCASSEQSDTPKCHKKCTNPSYSTPFTKDHHYVKGAYVISSEVVEIQKEIMEHGPIEAGFTVYSDLFYHKTGVYHYVTGDEVGGHAVKIIGWGVEDGTPYWLAANEWTDEWGDKGFFKILRGSNECGIESDLVAGIPKV